MPTLNIRIQMLAAPFHSLLLLSAHLLEYSFVYGEVLWDVFLILCSVDSLFSVRTCVVHCLVDAVVFLLVFFHRPQTDNLRLFHCGVGKSSWFFVFWCFCVGCQGVFAWSPSWWLCLRRQRFYSLHKIVTCMCIDRGAPAPLFAENCLFVVKGLQLQCRPLMKITDERITCL